MFVLILVLFDFLPFDLRLFKYLRDSLCLLLSQWTDDLLLLLADREVACDECRLRGGVQH